MARSLKKGPYVLESLQRKIEKMKLKMSIIVKKQRRIYGKN